ncbi:hypothetical protein ACFU99_41520 [Streptomyces sp. NPDC057654]
MPGPRRGVLRVCTTGDYAPFNRLDAKPKFVATTWAKLVDDLSAGR